LIDDRNRIDAGPLDFFRGRRVFVTGHTGFKGAWLCTILAQAGAEVRGYALAPESEPNLYTLARVDRRVDSVFGDVRDLDRLSRNLTAFRPEVVLHLAAQPIVRTSYEDPVGTYATNVMGTVNLLEAVRRCADVRSVVNVTTDKVYRNLERREGYAETDVLDGHDPYSNSKSCSELVTASYRRSFFAPAAGAPAVSTARAGNVIGGGDFARDRILPDCVRAAAAGEAVRLRNPDSVRPYQHVLDPVFAYLDLAARQAGDPSLADSYNIGPDDEGCVSTGTLATLFCESWGAPARWEIVPSDGPHEAGFLRLDCTKARRVLGFRPTWSVGEAVARTVEWSKTYLSHGDVEACMESQIGAFTADCAEGAT